MLFVSLKLSVWARHAKPTIVVEGERYVTSPDDVCQGREPTEPTEPTEVTTDKARHLELPQATDFEVNFKSSSSGISQLPYIILLFSRDTDFTPQQQFCFLFRFAKSGIPAMQKGTGLSVVNIGGNAKTLN